MKTKRLFRLLTALSFLLTILPVQAVHAAAPADMLQFTAGGHALGFTAGGMYAATGTHALHVDFVGANAVQPQADSPASSDGKAAPLSCVTYDNLWNGITLGYTADAGSIYTATYTLAPGADPAEIHLRYNAPITLNEDGALRIAFESGAMTESAPIAWQDINGQRVPVDASFRVSGLDVTFALGSYDPRYTLTIDPSLIWNTFLGGSAADVGHSIAVDGSGNVYVAGTSTDAWGSPVRAYGGSQDAFVAKLNSSGGLLWNTFLGGGGTDEGSGIAVDGSGNVYVIGWSIGTWGSPVRAYTGDYDTFAAKLDSSGTLTWNTFLGGSVGDFGHAIAVDGSGNVYVTGSSWATWGNPVRAYTGLSDVFAAKLDSSGGLTWNTFLGVGGEDGGTDIAVDGSGSVCVTGSSDANWGSPVRAYTSSNDTFVAKLNSSGGLLWNTFLGGSGADYGNGIALDGNGNVYVVGQSNLTWGAPLRGFAGGMEAYAAKLNSSGALIWNTFLGGSLDDSGGGIAVDVDGNVYVTGFSYFTWGSPVRGFSGSMDSFAAKLNSSGTLILNTFLGGSGEDRGYGIAADGNGSVYVAGSSGADWGSPVRAYTGDYDAFAAKVDLDPPTVVSSLHANPNPTNAASVDFTVTFSEPVSGVDTTDFALTTAGVTDASITDVSGSGTTYTVTVDTGSGNGTIRLDVMDDDTIQDMAGNPLGGVGAGNGNYTGGESYTVEKIAPGPFSKLNPANGANSQSTGSTLSWESSADAASYEYCYDTTNDNACGGSWTSTGTDTSIGLSGLSNHTTYYWQVRASNAGGTTVADGGTWWSFTARNQIFADVPIDHPLWQYIEAFYNAGITTGCGVSPLIYCPANPVTRASMAVFLLRAKYGSSYTPPAATHTFADLPVAGKEWQEAWVDQFYLEGITSGCGTGPLIYCPENPVTRAAMAVFILRAKYGSSYTPPAASHFFADLPVAGKEWMEPWVDELYREGITTGCGTGPLIYCPETAVKRQAMAAFIVRAFNLPLP